MAKKKSSKSSRAVRAKKQEVAKKKPTTKKVVTAAVIAEGSDEPVAKVEKAPAKKSPKKPRVKNIEATVEAEADAFAHESAEEMMQPTRNRMLLSALALAVIIVALIFGAGIIHQQSANKQAESSTKSGQDSGKADEILQSGGNVCTNGNSQADITGSANPESVGMMLQTNPTNEIQTPQTIGGSNDANTLQGASCF
jgi:hypothetical protein